MRHSMKSGTKTWKDGRRARAESDLRSSPSLYDVKETLSEREEGLGGPINNEKTEVRPSA